MPRALLSFGAARWGGSQDSRCGTAALGCDELPIVTASPLCGYPPCSTFYRPRGKYFPACTPRISAVGLCKVLVHARLRGESSLSTARGESPSSDPARLISDHRFLSAPAAARSDLREYRPLLLPPCGTRCRAQHWPSCAQRR